MVAQINRKMFKNKKRKIFGRLFCWLLVEGRPLTTKGRWINPLVFFSYKFYQLFPEKSKGYEPIYIIGTGRSGTTILGSLFSMHKDTVFLNEPKAIWHYIFPNEDIVGNYTLNEGSIRLNENLINEVARKKFSRIYSIALRVGLAKRVVDKYPELIYRVPFILKLLPKSKFILIVRNGIDTCSSVVNWSKNNSKVSKKYNDDWWGRNDRKWYMLVEQLVPEYTDLLPIKRKLYETSNHVDRAALEWILAMREGIKLSKSYEQVLVVKYENLCSNIDDNLDNIINHCDLEHDPSFTNYAYSILKISKPYGKLFLMPELVEPFIKTLKDTGYDESMMLVEPRR